MKKNEYVIDNGITLISHNLNDVHSVTISVNFRVGSIYEEIEHNGITHLVEHLFFRQWDTLNQSQLYFKMQCMGTEIIAKTYYDYVSFIITVVPEYFLDAFNLIIKCLNNFSWDDNAILTEKNIVCKQIDNKYSSYNEWINNVYLKDTSYEHPIMGSADTVKSLLAEDINVWKNKYFCSRNACVVITGKYSEEDFLLAKQELSNIASCGKYAEPIVDLPIGFNSRVAENRYSIISDSSQINDITVFFDVNKRYSYETLRLLVSIIGEGCGSKLSLALREKYNYTDDVFTDLISLYGFSRISVSFSVSNSDFFESLSCFFQVISDTKNSVSKNDYLTSINFFTKNQIMDLDNPNKLNSNYVLCDFVLKSIVSEPLEQKAIYEKITLNNLREYACEILTGENISFLIQTSFDESAVKLFLEETINQLL